MKSASSHDNQRRQKTGDNCDSKAKSSNVMIRNVVERKNSRVFYKFGLNILDWEAGSVLISAAVGIDGNAEGVINDFCWRRVDVSTDVAPGADCHAAQQPNLDKI